VADEIIGTSRINNNSSLALDQGKISLMSDAVSADKSWAFDGAYMLVRTAKTAPAADGTVQYNPSDFMLVGPDGTQYKFKDAGGTFGGTSTAITLADLAKEAGSIISGDGGYTVSAAGNLLNNITLGNDIAGVDISAAAGSKGIAAGSVLAKDSIYQLVSTKSLYVEVSGKEVKIELTAGGLKVGDELVAKGSSITLEDGTVLENDGTTDGILTVTSGSLTFARAVESGTDFTAAGTTIAKDSTLTAGTAVATTFEIGAGTIINDAKTVSAGSITLTLAATGSNIAFSGHAGTSLAAQYNDAAVGDSVTFIFSEYTAASSKLNDSVMAQIGANSGQTAFVSMGDMRARALGIADVNVATKWGAATAIETVNNALQKVSHQRSSLGAIQNRLEHTIKNLDTAAENLQAAESRIRDVDMAQEIMEFTKDSILQQASQAMLAQANQQPQAVLALLR